MMDLKQLRERLGLRYEQVGAAIGVSTNSVRDWENGVTVPRPYLPDVPKFLEVYQCSLETLVNAVNESQGKDDES
jgi:putative transcriptional regulator